jgi:GMP synthase (glutamine-hydrolysing)
MKKILLLQFRTDSTASHEIRYFNNFSLKCPVKIDSVNALDEKIKWSNPKELINGYDGVVLGGSGELCFSGRNEKDDKKLDLALENTNGLIYFLIKQDFPTLGICFGHQLIGHHLGVKIKKDKLQAKAGSFLLSLTEDGKNDTLFEGLPENFIAQYGHKDSLEKLPNNTKLLVSGKDKCKTSAIKYKNNIYSVQFHPEMNKGDLIKKMNIYSDYIDNEYEFKKNLKNSPHTSKIIENFIEKIV